MTNHLKAELVAVFTTRDTNRQGRAGFRRLFVADALPGDREAVGAIVHQRVGLRPEVQRHKRRTNRSRRVVRLDELD